MAQQLRGVCHSVLGGKAAHMLAGLQAEGLQAEAYRLIGYRLRGP
jgi:hypothetical protein